MHKHEASQGRFVTSCRLLLHVMTAFDDCTIGLVLMMNSTVSFSLVPEFSFVMIQYAFLQLPYRRHPIEHVPLFVDLHIEHVKTVVAITELILYPAISQK